MCGLGYLKIRDVESFSTMFLNYDLLSRRWVPYSYIYPYAETGAGILMIAAVLNWISVPVALFIGSVGATSVFKAVYLDKRELECACVGGSSNVPLGFVSFTENAAMIAMAPGWARSTCSELEHRRSGSSRRVLADTTNVTGRSAPTRHLGYTVG